MGGMRGGGGRGGGEGALTASSNDGMYQGSGFVTDL